MKFQTDNPTCELCRSRLKNVFASLTDAQVKDMTVEKNCSIFKKGQIVFNEGNRPEGMYCISKGKIKLYQTGEEGKEQILRLAKDGDILGYRSMISGEPYSASAAVIEEAIVCFVPKNTFFDFLRSNAELSTKMMQLLSHDLKEAESRITGLAQKPVRERMAETILMLREFYGVEKDNKTINAALSREDIANIVGTATETAIRILSNFRSEKIIDLRDKRIKITDHEGLVKAAHIYD